MLRPSDFDIMFWIGQFMPGNMDRSRYRFRGLALRPVRAGGSRRQSARKQPPPRIPDRL